MTDSLGVGGLRGRVVVSLLEIFITAPLANNNIIQVFKFNDKDTIRTIVDSKGDPWFVAKDICITLGITDPRKSVNLLDEDERNTVPVIDSLGRKQLTNIINEAGLYSLILRSRKPEARKFKRWITHEVLPSIRRTGSYSTQSQYSIPKTYAEALGYRDPRKAVADHCKAQDTVVVHDGKRGNPNLTIIPERDVYRLIMRSKPPTAVCPGTSFHRLHGKKHRLLNLIRRPTDGMKG